jgi:phosphoribosylformimino-5-aminoimidazole carboxamide ribotide isomerase
VDLLPAIDIRNGRVVRLSQGEPTRQTVYGDDPVAVANRFMEQGARWIHVVDLDRAFGVGSNLPIIRRVVHQVGSRVQVQVGGGLRTLELVQEAMELGAARAVIGTAAAMDPAFVPAAIAAHGAGRLAVGIDARDGLVALRGWTETSSRQAEDLAGEVVRHGVQILIYTDIGRDGMLGGPDLAGALALRASGARVIASGGVASAADVAAACAAGLAGVIVGRALYEGRLSLAEALLAASCSPVE